MNDIAVEQMVVRGTVQGLRGNNPILFGSIRTAEGELIDFRLPPETGAKWGQNLPNGRPFVGVRDVVELKGTMHQSKFGNTLEVEAWDMISRRNPSPQAPGRGTVTGTQKQKEHTVQTLEQLIAEFAVEVDPHLEREAEIPVNAGLQRQGDVIVIPTPRKKLPAGANPVPAAGIAVVRGENGGNTHLLLGMGEVQYADVTGSSTQLDVGVFTVAEGATAYLAHPEHGYMGIAPGTYTVRRQREQADEIRQVAD